MAENYGNNDGTLTVSDQSIVTNISCGDFSSKDLLLVGGSAAIGNNTFASVDSSTLVITGGKFSDFQETGKSIRNSIYAGSVAKDGGIAHHKNSTLIIIDGSSQGFSSLKGTSTSQSHGSFYGGGFNSAVSENINVTLQNVSLGFFNNQNEAQTSHVYAGSYFTAEGDYVEGNTNLTVKNAAMVGDTLGAGFVEGENIHLQSGHASVEVNDSFYDGYTSGINRWSGRVFGAGRMQYAENSTFIVQSSSVKVHNVSGIDHENGTTNITHDPGTRIFGAMQIYQSTKSLGHVHETSVYVDGDKTVVADVVGGGLISGTIASKDTSILSAGNTYAEVAQGTVSDNLVGGHIVNWFGISVIGQLTEQNGITPTYSEGSSTAVLSGGGNIKSLHVTGGSLAEYGNQPDQKGRRDSFV